MHELPPPPRPDVAWPARDAAYVDMSRSGMGLIIVGIALVGVLGSLATAGAIWPEDFLTNGGGGGERTVAVVMAVSCNLLFLGMVGGFVVWLRRRGLAVDQAGLWYVSARQAHLVPWQDITAVGGSFRVESRSPKASLGAAIGQEVMRRALTDDGRKFFAVEIFVRDPAVLGAGSDGPTWAVARGEPPRAGLPDVRLRLIIAGIPDYRRMASHLQHRVPHLWLGEYQRP